MCIKKLWMCFIFSMIALVWTTSSQATNIELKIKSEMTFKQPPVDMTFSRDGQWLYLLFKNGNLQIYNYQGEMKGTVKVGKEFDAIEPGPFEDEIYLLNRKNNKIQIVEVIPTRGIDLSNAPFKGAVDAPVVITEYTDFQCPYCAKLGGIFSQLLELYPGKIKIVYKSYPLNNHQYAWKAAANAMAAHQKGKFWPFHDQLFANHNALNDEKIKEIRKALGLDTPDFDALVKSQEIRSKVASDRSEGQRNGVRGTPTVFINGKRLKDKSFEGFKKAIEKQMKNTAP